MKSIRPVWILLTTILFCFSLSVSSQDIYFKNYSIGEGLSDNSVIDILQDKEGYLWFATLDGLSRYDGKFFRNFISIPGDTNSLSNSRIVKIREDHQGFIWCWSEDGTVQRVDPVKNRVLNLQSQVLHRNFLVKDFLIASNGDIWIWGKDGCIKLRNTEQSYIPKIELFTPDTEIAVSEVNFVMNDNSENLWIGTNKGLVKLLASRDETRMANYFYNDNEFISYNKTEKGIWFGTSSSGVMFFDFSDRNFSSPYELNTRLQNQKILCIHESENNRLLIGLEESLYDFNTEKNTFNSFTHPAYSHTTRIYSDSRKNTWIVTESKGIYRLDNEKAKLVYYPLNASDRLFLGDPDNQILFEDSNNSLWVGIHGGGLFLYDHQKEEFINYRYKARTAGSLSSDVILCLYEDYSKNLWIGTIYGGVNKINLKEEKFIWHRPVPKPQNTFDNEIRTIIQDKNGNIWVGSKAGKIYCYNSNYELLHTYPDELSEQNKRLLTNINVYSLFLDNEENLWIGTKGKGVFIIKSIHEKTAKKEIRHFNSGFSKELKGVFSIAQDKYGGIWLGAYGSGIARVTDPFGDPHFSLYNSTETPGKLVSDLIRYLFFDKKGNLWIGTSAGINVLHEKQLLQSDKSFYSVTSERNDITTLSYSNVDHLFQSSDNTIYAATMGGGFNVLKRYSFRDNFFEWQYYNKAEGLSSNKISAIVEDKENNIWLSSSLGINKFYPKENKIENFFVERQNDLNFFSESCGISTDNGDILFGHKSGFISFNPKDITRDTTEYPIVLSNFYINGVRVLPAENGILTQSIESETEINLSYYQNSIRFDFSVLDFSNPEKIQFTYKLENYNENWSTPLTENTAIFQNLPPGSYNFLLKATNSDGIESKQIRKLKIHISPPFYKSPLGYALTGILVLSFFIVFLYLYQRQIAARQKVVYVDKMNEKKLKYYTNISHEFKTPLSLIISPVEDILDDENLGDENRENAEQIKRNASYLLNLVEQILDFRKIREEKMTLSLSYLNISEFIKDIFHQFKPQAVKQNINLNLTCTNPNIPGYMDKKVVTKILYNLLSNAFQFTPPGKAVEIHLNENKKEGFVNIMVNDEGKGLKKAEQEKLFERFARSENSSGIGLFFVKELVNIHKGNIEVSSEEGKGTSFRISLPVQKRFFPEEEIGSAEKPTDQSVTTITDPGETYDMEAGSNKKARDSILIVEDNKEMQAYLTRKFKSDYKVLIANNGKEGVDIAFREIPELIVCDLMMPVMDGLEVVELIRKNFQTSHIPLILLTANSSEENRVKGLETGADDYITKPFNFKLLKIKIDNLISRRKNLFSSFGKEPGLPANVLTHSDHDKDFIEKVSLIIEENIGKADFSVDFVSAQSGCSRTGFYKKIKGITGETPHTFINTIQMKKAALLLRETNYSIPDISLMVGYNNTNYFTKNFKKHFGNTPKSWQIEARKHKKTSKMP